jgi:hypothetical protein
MFTTTVDPNGGSSWAASPQAWGQPAPPQQQQAAMHHQASIAHMLPGSPAEDGGSHTPGRRGSAPPQEICKYHSFGGCTKGDQCPFSHDLSVVAATGADASAGFMIVSGVKNMPTRNSPPPQQGLEQQQGHSLSLIEQHQQLMMMTAHQQQQLGGQLGQLNAHAREFVSYGYDDEPQHGGYAGNGYVSPATESPGQQWGQPEYHHQVAPAHLQQQHMQADVAPQWDDAPTLVQPPAEMAPGYYEPATYGEAPRPAEAAGAWGRPAPWQQPTLGDTPPSFTTRRRAPNGTEYTPFVPGQAAAAAPAQETLLQQQRQQALRPALTPPTAGLAVGAQQLPPDALPSQRPRPPLHGGDANPPLPGTGPTKLFPSLGEGGRIIAEAS